MRRPRAGPRGRIGSSSPSSRRSWTPNFSASRSTDSVKVSPSTFLMKEMTSPPSPQPKQWKNWRAGLTLNDGVFSSWKGHSPESAPPPADFNVTY